jgi:hypothetical protein
LRTAPTLTLICMTAFALCEPVAIRAEGLLAPCAHCNVLIGVGTTFHLFTWTDAVLVPLTLELDDSRWELGAFRFTGAQRFAESRFPANAYAAYPYWGFTAMRRWQVLHRSWGKLYLGFGGNYRTEIDYLEATRWNFAYLVAARFEIDSHGRLLELGLHHWSDAWIKPPNRGQNFLTLGCAF